MQLVTTLDQNGRAWLIELKETQDVRLRFDALREQQHQALSKVLRTGNQSLVVVKYCPKDLREPERCWAYNYRGIQLEMATSTAKSIHLLDEARYCIANDHRIELRQIETRGLLPVWNLAPMFRGMK